MILLNFSDHLAQIDALVGRPIARIIDAPAQFDVDASFVTQVGALVDGIGLSPVE